MRREATIDRPCAVAGCDRPRLVMPAGVESRCREHRLAQRRANYARDPDQRVAGRDHKRRQRLDPRRRAAINAANRRAYARARAKRLAAPG